jgi:hypothetical protein
VKIEYGENPFASLEDKWHFENNKIAEIAAMVDSLDDVGFVVRGVGLKLNRDEVYVAVPYWSLVLIASFRSYASWFHWPKRFSLRTLLVGMTVVALLLGALIYAAR